MCFPPQFRPIRPRKPSEQTLEGIRKSILFYTPKIEGTLDIWDVVAHACGTAGVEKDPVRSQEGVDRVRAIETAIEQVFDGRYDKQHLHRHVTNALVHMYHNHLAAHGQLQHIPSGDSTQTCVQQSPTPQTHPDRYIRPLKLGWLWWLKLGWGHRY